MLGFLLAVLAAGALLQAAPAPSRGVCGLLEAAEIRTVQDVAITDRKTSEQTVRGLNFAQCVFATTDFARSVSLTLITGHATGSGASARGYWTDTFHGRPKPVAVAPARPAKPNAPPRAISDTGDEAFWTGDARAGALYVLSGDAVLRISVGGVHDEEERIRRSRTLARAALNRLHQER